ncbi:hypothetical protein BBK82_41430 [Lentzea guizhouensis]|uniref:Integrase catalytic domain-containing protein n=1 Tax=Lentzea guizhouensis TaxID=1586287 RepID=A0A1B2HUQ0_9PSEU|nr:hypothetical protein BBK82_41430 [Lentzea guizhouensis]
MHVDIKAYSEVLSDEKKETATAFWWRAQIFFRTKGITVERMLTDNGSCYRSPLWCDTLADAGITHKRTRPYRPQTNGKGENFNRTLLDEWAYARPYRTETERWQAGRQSVKAKTAGDTDGGAQRLLSWGQSK